MLRYLVLLACAVCLLSLQWIVNGDTSQNNGRLLQQNDEPVKSWPTANKRFALIIGVDQYQDSQISTLTGATNDAKALAAALIKHAGFPPDQVLLLASDQPADRQPTRGNILRRLSNLRTIVPKDGLLVISFAGHGIVRDKKGFLVTSDAQINSDFDLLEATALKVDTIKSNVEKIGVKQVVMIMDACRNNPTGRGESANPLTETFTQGFNFDTRNKDISAFATLYATALGEVAYEYKEKKQGYFTYMLIEGLKGGAANDKGEVTLSGLVRYLQENVPKRISLDLGSGKFQKPFAVIEGYKADDLVISVTVNVTIKQPSVEKEEVNNTAAFELSFWNSIKDSKDVNDFQAYLDKYPNGEFTVLARNKITNLNKPAVTESRPVQQNTTTPTQPTVQAPKEIRFEVEHLHTFTRNAYGLLYVVPETGIIRYEEIGGSVSTKDNFTVNCRELIGASVQTTGLNASAGFTLNIRLKNKKYDFKVKNAYDATVVEAIGRMCGWR